MPAQGALTKTLIDTGNLYQDAVDNTVQVINEHLPSLSVQGKSLLSDNVVNYDEIKVFHTPFISVVFDNAVTAEQKMNNCLEMVINVVIYYYFESLNFGIDTHPFIGALYKLTEIFIVHWDLYGFTKGTGRNVEILDSSIVGRKLDADVFLTGQVNLAIHVRTCRDDHL